MPNFIIYVQIYGSFIGHEFPQQYNALPQKFQKISSDKRVAIRDVVVAGTADGARSIRSDFKMAIGRERRVYVNQINLPTQLVRIK